MKTAFDIRKEKQDAREQRKADRLAKQEARAEKQRITKLSAKKMTPAQVKNVLNKIDPDGKFSAKKVKALTKRISQLGGLRPAVISNRLRARKAQVDMIEAIFEQVATKK